MQLQYSEQEGWVVLSGVGRVNICSCRALKEVCIFRFYYKNNGSSSGNPVVKASPSNSGAASSIPGWGAKISHGLGPKKTKHKTEAVL